MKSELKNKINLAVQHILNREHINDQKKIYKDFGDRLNFACPICGDSTHDACKKRANIYYDSMSFHCFNCGYHSDVMSFFKRYNENSGFSLEETIDMITIAKDAKVENTSNYADIEIFEKLNKYALDEKQLQGHFKWHKLVKDTPMYEYVSKRCLSHQLTRFRTDDKRLYILNFASDGRRILGFQLRNFGKAEVKKYMSYTLERIYQELGLSFDEEKEMINKMRSLSIYFNLMTTNYRRPVTVFEGPIDAMFIPNSVALSGIDRNNSFFDNLQGVRFMFDNDDKGRSVAMEKLKNHKSVFLWQKFLSDHELPLEIKDMNELICYGFEHKIKLNKFDDYFSSDEMDMIYV